MQPNDRKRCSARVFLIIATVVLAAALTAPSQAQQIANPDLDRVRTEIDRLRKRLDVVQKQTRNAQQEMEAVDLELRINARELDIALDMQARIERERGDLEAQVNTLVERIAAQKRYLRKRLVALYRLGGLSYVRLFMSVDQQHDPSAALSMLSFLVSHDATTITRFQAMRLQLDGRRVELADRQRKLAQVAEVIQQKRQTIAASRSRKERMLQTLLSEESGSTQQIAELEEKARRLERLVDVLSRQSTGEITAADVRSFRGALAWPVEGTVIEHFGRQRNAKFATYTVNNGLKIAAAPRAAVRAIFQGTVLFAQWFKGYGNLIILDHGNRVFSLYGNLNGPTVNMGDRITTGQAIAGVGEGEDGKSGYLYFEIRQDNRPEDPQKWLR